MVLSRFITYIKRELIPLNHAQAQVPRNKNLVYEISVHTSTFEYFIKRYPEALYILLSHLLSFRIIYNVQLCVLNSF